MENDTLEWEPLVSSHVDAMAFVPSEAMLFVRYRNGAVYSYPSDAEEAEGLRRAQSPGQYVNFFLKQKGRRFS